MEEEPSELTQTSVEGPFSTGAGGSELGGETHSVRTSEEGPPSKLMLVFLMEYNEACSEIVGN